LRNDVPVTGKTNELTTGVYSWKSPIVPVAELPAIPQRWIDEFLPKRQHTISLQSKSNNQNKNYVTGQQTYREGTAYSRCRAYLEQVEPCIAGQHGDAQLYKTACIIFWDFGLSETEGMALLQEYNTRCQPPWSQSRLDYKMDEVLTASHSKERGHLLHVTNEINNSVDLSEFMVQTVPKTDKSSESMPESLLYIPGFVHDVTEFSLSGAPHPNPQIATLGALACQSFLVSRKVRSASTARPSVYLLALAGSGTGKDYPRLVNQFILTRIGMGAHIVDTCASGEGLEDLIIVKQVLLMQTDEFNFMLSDFAKGIESRFRTLESLLLRLYSAAHGSHTGRVKAGKELPLTVQQPGLVVFGTATPERFRRALTMDMIEGGLASRCIILESDERRRGQKAREVDEIPDDILERATYWSNFVPVNSQTGKPDNLNTIYPNLYVIPLSPDAETIMTNLETYADDRNIRFAKKNPIAATLWTRVHESAGRLAVIYACSKNHREPVIDKDAARWASEFTVWTCERLNQMIKRHVAENAFHAIWLRIEDTIRNNGGHASQSTLIDKLKISSKQLQEAVEAMGIGQRIALTEVPTKGRPRMEYILLDDKNKSE
jgi:hypothetical protein